MNARKLWNSLGPGILLAAASVGASHLVFSPQAGARFGYQLLWLVVASHLFKYPAFEFGPRYAAATGHHLLDGYARIPGPKNWALIVFLVSTLVQGVGVLAGVVSIAGSVLWTWTHLLSTESLSVLLTGLIVALLFVGGFSWLDHLNKIMMAVLALATVLAFLPIIPGPEAWSHLVVPALPAGSVVLVAAMLGWMPTGIDVSVWHSFWTIEKIKQLEQSDGGGSKPTREKQLRTSLLDMRVGYGLSLGTGVMFVIMGAVHLAGQGEALKGVEFAQKLSVAYTDIFGRWMYHVFMLTALFAMFSTSYTVIDGFSRSFSECCAVLFSPLRTPERRKRIYFGFVIASALLACGILVTLGSKPVMLVTAAALVSLTAAPLLYGFNLYCVLCHVEEPRLRPATLNVCIACAGIVFMLVALAVTVYVRMGFSGPDSPPAAVPADPSAPATPGQPSPGADRSEKKAIESTEPDLPATKPRKVHPLLAEAGDAVLAEGIEEIPSTAGPELAALIPAVARSATEDAKLAPLTIDYPLDESIFPPEIVPPTFLWHDPAEQVDTWLFDVALGDGSEHVYVLSPGGPPPAGDVDPRCITKTNEIYEPTPYQASAQAWTPTSELWAAIKRRSVGQPASVTILGLSSAAPAKALSRGRMTMTTSKDPLGAPIFYRDVPLAPSKTQQGVIKPLDDDDMYLIAWRLRDVSKPESRLLLEDVPTCTNCHSFSADGSTLGMDLDGPKGDKGAYVITRVAEQTVIEPEHVISWNSFPDKPKDHKTIGFLSRMSPDGQHAVTTLNESVFVSNFVDYRFLQVFYPTRGILGYYSRATGEIKALPGADDPQYVHCDPVWTPDGEHLVFARAEAKNPYPEKRRLPTRPNDPNETPIRYDLCRMPFGGGRGGQPEPIAGASQNGMSNTFPKVSPDGKWIVFVQCRNGQLMRPDSKLWIVPAEGGTARRMRANTWRMNSWHSFSPNGRWLVFSSKANTPYTQMFLTHIDEQGNDSPAILVPNSTAANRAVNLPEFVNVDYEQLQSMRVPALEYLKLGLRGARMAKREMLDEAMALFEKALELNPEYSDGHVHVAVLLARKGKLDEGIARLEALLARDPRCWLGHANLGVLLARKGMLDQAAAAVERALELNPTYSDARVNLGVVLAEKGMLEEATAQLGMAVRLDLENPVTHFNLGNVLLKRRMHQQAVAELKTALDLDPDYPEAHAAIARALFEVGLLDQATAHYRAAAKLDPEDPVIQVNLGKVLFERGQLDEAAVHFRKSLDLDPQFIDARLMLANALAVERDFPSALAEVEDARQIDPDNPRVINDLAWLLATCPSDAIRDGAKAIQLIEPASKAAGGQDPELLSTLAAAYAETGRWSDAVTAATTALHLAEPHSKPMAEKIRRHLESYRQHRPIRWP